MKCVQIRGPENGSVAPAYDDRALVCNLKVGKPKLMIFQSSETTSMGQCSKIEKKCNFNCVFGWIYDYLKG